MYQTCRLRAAHVVKDDCEVSDEVWAFAPPSAHVHVVDFAPKSADFCATSLLNYFFNTFHRQTRT